MILGEMLESGPIIRVTQNIANSRICSIPFLAAICRTNIDQSGIALGPGTVNIW